MAVSFTQGNDFIVPTEDGQTYLGGAGNDTYMLSDATVAANSTIVIQDTEGTNNIQLVGGLSIASSMVTSNALELTLSNGAKVQILGADSFGYDVGGNALAGTTGTEQTFTELVENTLGTTVPAAGEDASEGGAVEVPDPTPTPEEANFSIAASSDEVIEGSDATFTITLSQAQAEETTVNYAVELGGDASAADHGAITVDGVEDSPATGTLTFAAGEVVKTITIPVSSDSEQETGETIGVTLSEQSEGIELGAAADVVTLVDPPPPTFSITSDAVAGAATIEGNTITYTITPSSITDKAYNFTLTTVGDTVGGVASAASAADFSPASETVSFAAGQTEAVTVVQTVVNEGAIEGLEGYKTTLLDSSLEAVGDSFTGLITDPAGSTGQTFTLTNSFNQTTGGVDNLVGTAGDDTIIGSVSGTASNSTYSVGDVIDGGEGDDTLNISATADTDSVDVTNVESVLVRNTSAAIIDFDATSVVGATSIVSNKSNSAVDIQGIASKDTKVGAFSTDQHLYFGFTTTETSGTEDAATVTLDTVGTSTTNVNVFTENIEVLNLESNGTAINYLGEVASDANNNNAAIAGAETLTKLSITGSADLRIATALDAGITEIDASAATGNLRLGQEGTVSKITTGSGNDRIDVGVAGSLTTDDTIDGGEGTDAIVIADGFGTALTKVTNIEQLRTADTANGLTDTYDMSTIESLEEVIIADGDTDHSGGQNGAEGNGTDFDNIAVTNGEGKLTSVVDVTANINYTDKSNKASMTLTLDNSETTAKTDGIDLSGTVTIDSVETLTIDSVGGMLAADSTNSRTGLQANSVIIADGTQIATVNITGDTDVEVTASAETGAKTFNASAHTGNVKLTVNNGTDKTITMGAGNDRVDLGNEGTANTNNSTKVTIDMAAGNDTVSLEAEDLESTDSIAGGDGTDTLVFSTDLDVGDLTKAGKLNGVSSFENVQMASTKTLTLSDAAVSKLGGSSVYVTPAATAAGAVTVVASAVTQANSTVTVDGSGLTGTGSLVYTGSNAIDGFTGTINKDLVTIGQAVLQATDTFAGGGDDDVFNIDFNNATTNTVTESAGDLVNVSSFNYIGVNDATNAAAKIAFVLDNNIVDKNASSNTLNLGAGTYATNGTLTASDDKVTINASGVTSDVKLVMTGGTAADTLTGGAGEDEINGGNDGDSLTGGAGKDDFNFSATGGTVDTIKDLDLGTNTGTANVDQIDIKGLVGAGITGAYSFAVAYAGGTATIIKDSATADGAGTTGNAIAILDNSTYADTELAENALLTLFGAAGETDDAIVIWADSFNQVHISVDDNVGVDAGGLLDVAVFDGLSLTGVVSALDLGDIIIA